MGVAVCSGETVKWSGAGDGSSWSDPANWVDGGTVDFTKTHVYDLSAAEDGANLVNDKVSSIGGFVLGAGQGTVTLSSTVAASALRGAWTIPASTTFVLRQVYQGMWSDYGTTTVSGGGTLRLDAADFQSANRAWNIEGGTVVELARGYPNLLLAQLSLRGGSVLKVMANGTKLGTLVVDAASCVEVGDRTLTVCGGESGGYTMDGAVTGTGTIAFSGGKDISATASFPDFSGTLELGNASLTFKDGCSIGRDVAFVAKDNGVLALGGDQVVGSISGLGTSGGLSIPGGAVATVSGTKAASGGTMLFRATIRGEGGLTLDAPGKTLVLNGVNGYRGPTRVAAGTLTMRNDRHTGFPGGLVARYSFDETFLGDSSLNGNDLTVPYAWTTMPVQAEDGIAGTKCARFSRLDASGGLTYSCLQSSQDLPLSGRVPFTVSLWIRPTRAASDTGVIVVGAPAQSDAKFTMTMVEGNSGSMNVRGFGHVGLGGDQTGKWCHLVLAQAADGSRKFYVNKVLKASAPAGTNSDLVSQPLVLGDFVKGSWGPPSTGTWTRFWCLTANCPWTRSRACTAIHSRRRTPAFRNLLYIGRLTRRRRPAVTPGRFSTWRPRAPWTAWRRTIRGDPHTGVCRTRQDFSPTRVRSRRHSLWGGIPSPYRSGWRSAGVRRALRRLRSATFQRRTPSSGSASTRIPPVWASR